MGFHRRLQSTHLDARAVVGNLEQLHTALFDEDLKTRGAGVDSILDKFLQSVDRSDNNLPCRNFVHHSWVQSLGEESACVHSNAVAQGVLGCDVAGRLRLGLYRPCSVDPLVFVPRGKHQYA